jgi:hypothetical protein
MVVTLVHFTSAGRVGVQPVMMGVMAPEPQPTDSGTTPPETVVEFGAEPDESRRERRRWSLTEFAGGLARDRRTVPLAAAVGAVALFASLVSEWQITQLVMDPTGENGPDSELNTGPQSLPAGITDLGALGGGYLAGLFLLAAAVGLVLFGPVPARRCARLIGLSTGGVLIALLAATFSELDDRSRSVTKFLLLVIQLGPENNLTLSYGRGLWCAFFGVAAVMLALYLAGRHETPIPVVADEAEPAPDQPQPTDPEVWSWRRPRSEDDGPPDAPFDLTVSSAKPFTPSTDERDKPN